MKKSMAGSSNLLMSVVEIVIGILLLINPVGFTSGIVMAFGAVMTVIGVTRVIQYFCTDAAEAAKQGYLANGIIFALIGVFCAFRSGWLIATFPVITVLYGILILAAGISKLQKAVDMIRLHLRYWPAPLIGAVLTVVFAVLILANPFASTAVLWSFIGITLIIEAVVDVVAFVLSKRS